MTAGEVCKVLDKLPPHLPVTVYIEQELTVSDRAGDRVSGVYSGIVEVADIGVGKAFSPGIGYYPVIALEAGEEC